MTTWVVPSGDWQTDDATEGDFLLRAEGDTVLVAQVGKDSAEWLGPLPEGALDIPAVDEPTERPDLTATVAPMAMALSELGG